MKKTTSVVMLLMAMAGSSAALADSKANDGITISTNIPGGVTLNCVANNGGTGTPITITSNSPYSSWWGGLSSNFNGTNLQCTFNPVNDPKQVIGSAQIIVWDIDEAPYYGSLAGSVLNILSAPGYDLAAQGTKKAPRLGPVYFDYAVTMSKN